MSQEKLNQEDKEAIARAISFYYENYVWKDFVSKDESAAGAEDYNLRYVTKKLKLELPDRILQRL